MTLALMRYCGFTLLSMMVAGCGPTRVSETREMPERDRGAQLIRAYGCGACHRIPDVRGARGNVGPSLERLPERVYLAGFLPNTPENLARWIREPQSIAQATAMPDLGISADDAAAMAAYFYRKAEAE